jgi:hypothetical protein
VHQFITQTIRPIFNDDHASFFGVIIAPEDQDKAQQMNPGIRYFWDFDTSVSTLYQALKFVPEMGTGRVYTPFTLVLDPSLRLIARIGMNDPEKHNQLLGQLLQNLPAVDDHAGTILHAPVLIVPRIFEPELCQALIQYYHTNEVKDSGFMREENGRTIPKIDHSFKRRSDCEINDAPLREATQSRLRQRLFPEIIKAFQFTPTQIEHYIVACYDSQSQGFFRPHRDNTTKGTAHRKFAVTMNLNAEGFTGGELRFPEFGSRTYRAPTGGAVVFSCSLLHEAMPVLSGDRYAFLPFLYDQDGAAIRQQNMAFIG